MSTPEPGTPQPRDIAIELGTPEQTADLEAQSSTAGPTSEHEPTPEPSAGS